jgi:16S rRNA A1518/A1519 N6-dimethyltransferase RsmA/KsgA/DIM1 with predicted DNA glycosylase/AP lyase activity
VDQIDDMVANIGRGYDLEFEDPPPKVQSFYKLLAASEKSARCTDVTVLQAMTRLMAFKSKYKFLNRCYNDIVKLIIDLIPAKHNMLKELHQSKKIMSGLGTNYEKIVLAKKLHVILEGTQG